VKFSFASQVWTVYIYQPVETKCSTYMIPHFHLIYFRRTSKSFAFYFAKKKNNKKKYKRSLNKRKWRKVKKKTSE
jgi:phosphotransferase system  glucose/maltose/N-acetylglucosamine-specific IIC component